MNNSDIRPIEAAKINIENSYFLYMSDEIDIVYSIQKVHHEEASLWQRKY